MCKGIKRHLFKYKKIIQQLVLVSTTFIAIKITSCPVCFCDKFGSPDHITVTYNFGSEEDQSNSTYSVEILCAPKHEIRLGTWYCKIPAYAAADNLVEHSVDNKKAQSDNIIEAELENVSFEKGTQKQADQVNVKTSNPNPQESEQTNAQAESDQS